jgi:glycogen phosphorylase
VTNGITPRRWLIQANPRLSADVDSAIGHGWRQNLEEISALAPLSQDRHFRARIGETKLANKQRLAEHIRRTVGIEVDPQAMFDVHVKRIHEYKRQLLNIMGVVARWNAIRSDPRRDWAPRVVVLAGKAASAYWMAKLIIKLIHDVARRINDDPAVGDRLKVVFLPNYDVSLAEIIIPAADLSQQISLAGTEASGTGNMKLALNGALTIGTEDGANVEIAHAVGRDNIFLFGMTVEDVVRRRAADTRHARSTRATRGCGRSSTRSPAANSRPMTGSASSPSPRRCWPATIRSWCWPISPPTGRPRAWSMRPGTTVTDGWRGR